MRACLHLRDHPRRRRLRVRSSTQLSLPVRFKIHAGVSVRACDAGCGALDSLSCARRRTRAQGASYVGGGVAADCAAVMAMSRRRRPVRSNVPTHGEVSQGAAASSKQTRHRLLPRPA
jgi:hypothetical protein